MNITLMVFVIAYLLGTLAIGVWAGTRIKTTTDFALAGRNLPFIMIVTTTFAKWFGAETVMGVPAKFVQGGLGAIVEDPFGAGTCLILVGAFFAAKLYRMNLLTIGDFYRQRYGKGVEVFCSVAIILSYLGWVAAQITALGLVFNVLTGGAMSESNHCPIEGSWWCDCSVLRIVPVVNAPTAPASCMMLCTRDAPDFTRNASGGGTGTAIKPA